MVSSLSEQPTLPGDSFTATQPTTNVIRLTSTNSSLYQNALPSDWLYLVKDATTVSWSSGIESLYHLKSVGLNKFSTNQIYTGLSAVGLTYSSVTASTQKGRNVVTVTKNGHTLKTGDLVTISTATAIGGISAVNLSQLSASIIVLDANRFTYLAGANATSDNSGTIANLGTNLIEVTHATHGFSSGALVTVSTASLIGDIAPSVASTPIEVLTQNTYRYRATTANGSFPLVSGAILASLTYLADSWVEFEVSSSQMTSWTAILSVPQLLTEKMTYIFKSSVVPQLVDFGSVGTMTIDQVVVSINNQIAGGSAVKLSPQQLEIRTNDYQNGTVAVLASVGNSLGMIQPSIDSSRQAHAGFSQSGNTQTGFPVVNSVALPTSAISGYASRTYLNVDKTFTDILDTNANPSINSPAIVSSYPEGFENIWLTGRESGLTARVYNNQTTTPFTGILSGTDIVRPIDTVSTPVTNNRYTNYSLRARDLSVSTHDKLTVELDLDPTDKTVAIQLAKKAKILAIDALTGAGKGQVISLRLKDPDDSNKAFFDNTSVYKAFDFTDFKLLTKSVGLYREGVSDRALILRSAEFGANAKLRMSIRLPAEPDKTTISVTHINDFYQNNARTNLVVTLPSQSLIANSTLSTGSYKVEAVASSTLYNWRISSGLLNSTNAYAVSNVLNISGTGALAGSYYITASSYSAWAGSAISTTPGSSTVVVTQPSHGYTNGDLVDISAGASVGGISSANLSGSFPITVLGLGSFSYTALLSSPSDTGTIASVTRPAITITNPTFSTDGSTSTVTVVTTGHGLQTGNKVNVSLTLPASLGGISLANLNQTNASIIRLDGNTFTYVAGAVSSSVASTVVTGSVTRPVATYTSLSALTVPGSANVQLTHVAHDFSSGDLIAVSALSDIGGITLANLTQLSTSIVVTSVNTFTYTASASSPVNAGFISSVTGGGVSVKAPGSGGLSTSAIFTASQNVVRSWDIVDKTLTDLATAINAYSPLFPVATAEAIGSNIATNPISLPTYMAYPNTSIYSGSDVAGAFNWHSFETKYSGSAGIWQYDSSNASLNNIKATVQSDDSIYPTTTDASGTSYSPIDEEVYLVPTNTKTLSLWLNFNASSSLSLLANIERMHSDNTLQIASVSDGSSGAVKVTGVTANAIASGIVGNATTIENSSVVRILTSEAKSLVKNSIVKVQNTISSELLRPYRLSPTTPTTTNTTEINTFFRQTNSCMYIRINSSKGRIIFLRDGLGSGQTQPIVTGNTVTFTNLGSGLVQVTSAIGGGTVNTGKLRARTGDQMYIQPDAINFTVDQRCKAIGGKITDPTLPEYLGFPVVHVIDDNNVVIIAPSITNFSTIAVGGSEELVFMPAVWNEKNIRTNHKEGTDFDSIINSDKMYFLVKSIGSGFVSVFAQNSSAETTDDLRLDTMSVGIDDVAIFSEGFDAANRGAFRIVAHNSRNHLIIYNPNGGKDELIDTNTLENGGLGDRIWRVGASEGTTRPIRIVAGESVKLGDLLRISTSPALTQWFNSAFFGSWTVSGIGYAGIDYSLAGSAPYTESSGIASQYHISPYIDFDIPNAPLAVFSPSNVAVDKFLIGDSHKAIGFVEETPFSGLRLVSGFSVSPENVELTEVFLTPQFQTSKMSDVFGSILTAFGKTGFAEQAYQGIDGYKVFSGLVGRAQVIIDGLPTNTVLYPGVKAAGATVEVLPPLIRAIQVALQVRPKDGVTLNSITDLVKATVSNYVNSLGVGTPVVLSEIVRVVQSLPGVFSVQIASTTPVADSDRIVVASIEKAYILNIAEDLTVG
jgi:hypothetical protein